MGRLILLSFLALLSACSYSTHDLEPPEQTSKEYYEKIEGKYYKDQLRLYLYPEVSQGENFLFKIQAIGQVDNSCNIMFKYVKNGEYKNFFSAPLPVDGSNVEFILPPLVENYSQIVADINIPNGSIQILAVSCRYTTPSPSFFDDIKFHAHLGLISLTPENTQPSFEYCGKSRFLACITTPIESKDGVLFCYHENNKRLMNSSNSLTSLSADQFKNMTSEEILSEFDAGKYKSNYWEGTPICKLDDYFLICHKYNMAPTFSTHPAPSDSAWQKIKSLVEYYNLKESFTIKAFNPNILKKAYKYFGDSIRAYILDCKGTESDIATIVQLDLGLAVKGIEASKDDWTEDSVERALGSGLFVSAYSIGNNGADLKRLIKWGVTEFTSDYYTQYSNWMDNNAKR